MQATLQQKQQFLRSQILEAGVDPQSFMAFMGTVKEQGESINLQNWTLAQLKQCVQDFKLSLQQQIKRAKSQLNNMRQSKQLMTSRIMESIEKKQKVFYERDDLWDYQMNTEQQCRKLPRVFDFKFDPQIDYKSWEMKKTGGIIFGIGAKNQLWITYITNFTTDMVTRKSQDVDWLRETLISKFPGSYVPPLEQTRYLQPQDKVGIMRRVKQIILFLNSLVNFDHLVQNKYFQIFISEKDPKKFNDFKSRLIATKITPDISSIQNLQGKFSVQISKRALGFVKQSSEYGRFADQIHLSLQTNLRKILADLQTLQKHSHYVANDFAKFHQKHEKMAKNCGLKQIGLGQRMSTMLIFLNKMFTSIGNQYKKQLSLIKQTTDDFMRYNHAEWTQFLLHDKRYNVQLNNYLTFKYNLQKKKQRNINDVSKWQLDQKQQFRMSRVNTTKMDKEQAFQLMYPKDNKMEAEMRIWQAYINDMYQKSFLILINEQQRQYLKNFGKYCNKMDKLTQQQNQLYKKFAEIFGSTQKPLLKQKQNSSSVGSQGQIPQ